MRPATAVPPVGGSSRSSSTTPSARRRGDDARPQEGQLITDSNKTLIAALLDRSGSMQTSKAATEDGWRELINAQRLEPGQCQVTLAQFDTHYEVLYANTDIAAVPTFTVEPRGMTALLDACGRFITEIGERLSALPEHERPGNVICLIMTDGMENSSHEWSWDAVRKLITQQQDEWSWKFIFLGANMDAVSVGGQLGVPQATAMTYNDDDEGAVRHAYERVSHQISRSRSGRPMGFSQADRDSSVGRPSS